MQADFKQMVKEMLGFEGSEEISEEALFRLTNVFAYSPFVQYLYSRHLKEKNDHRYAASVAKTALYFSNPHWLHHQLRNGKNESLEDKESRMFHVIPTAPVLKSEEQQLEDHVPQHEETKHSEVVSDFNQHAEIQKVDFQEDSGMSFDEPDAERLDPEYHEALLSHNSDGTSVTELSEEDVRLEEPDGFNEHQGFDRILDELNHEIEQRPEATNNPVENEAQVVETQEPESASENNEAPVYPEFNIQAESEMIREPDVTFPEPEPMVDMPEAVTDHSQPGEPEVEQTEAEEQYVKKLVPATNQESGIPDKISFEPLYTIDYFASQGIRLSQEEENKDQLSSRLKSFTEWLKSMKKLHPEKLSREMDEKTELTIKNEAEHSNDQAEVLTETMAEILIDQGLTEKALEIYEKLSLLNPSKSDYFAAKISAIKSQGI